MLLKKKSKTKEVNRIQKRREKTLHHKVILTVVLSFLAIILAFIFTEKQFVVSPLPVLSMSTTGDIEKKVGLELKKLQITSKNIDERGDHIVINLDKNKEVIIPTSQDIAGELASLQLIMRQLTMEGKKFTRIDLRFDKPVITF